MNNEANDQIRDTYMGKVGLQRYNNHDSTTVSDSETSSLRMAGKDRGQKMSGSDTEDSRSLAGTMDMNVNTNEKIQIDQLSPKEVKRTTVIFNENSDNPKQKMSRHSEQINNLDGYFLQKQAT